MRMVYIEKDCGERLIIKICKLEIKIDGVLKYK